MDASEALANKFLESYGFSNIQYEPDGNIPPDFLCDHRVAVEVRRLNQHYNDGLGPKGLEEVAIPLWKGVRKVLLECGPPTDGQSWFVFYRFARPLPKLKRLRVALKKELLDFKNSIHPQPFKKDLIDGFHLQVFRASTPKQTFFVPAGHSDSESGGFLLNEIEKNLTLCITEKMGKIASVRSKYAEWWLVLADHIGYGLDGFERQLFRQTVSISPHTFHKIFLLDPRDPKRFFEV